MAQIGNLRFPKTFVLNTSAELIVAGTPDALTPFQVGIFNAKTLVGAGAAPAPTAVPVIQIHQNVGDNKFGTVRTKSISAQQVRRWHAVKNSASVAQVLYIGYDEVDATKTLTAYVGQDMILAISVYDEQLRRFFGPVGYTERIVFDAALCAPCIADCTLLDPDVIADFFVAYINGTNYPAGNFPVTLELTNWVTAVKVATGTQGAVGRKTGIKLTVNTPPIKLLNVCNTQQFYQTQLTTITASVGYNCPNFPITTTVKAKSGNGYPLEVVEMEMESQGYDRVRDVFEEIKFMRNNFIIRAQDGVKYDFYYLEFDHSHQSSGLPKDIKDPYIIIFPVVAGQGGTLEAFFNAWLGPLGFDAVTVAAGSGKGGTIQQVNA